MFKMHVGNPLTIYTGLSGPPGPKPRKSLKKVSRGLRPRAPPCVWNSLEKVFRDLFETFSRLSIGKDQKGFRKRGIHDQGDFYKNLLETTVENALKMRKSDLFMDTPFLDTPFGPARLQTFSRLFPDSRGVPGPDSPGDFFRLFRGFGPGGPERPL